MKQEKIKKSKLEVEKWGLNYGYPIKGIDSDGNQWEIVRIENGRPIYRGVSNLNAAETVSTDEVWQGGSASLSLNGSGITIGLWDGGLVCPDAEKAVMPNSFRQPSVECTVGNKEHILK